MGFTKKQRREQKKHFIEQKFKDASTPKRKTINRRATMYAAIKATWTTPDGEQPPDYKTIAAPRSTNLEQLQQQVQEEMEERARQVHPGWSVKIEISETDHALDDTPAEHTTFPFPEKIIFNKEKPERSI
jgi:hypothetical protein